MQPAISDHQSLTTPEGRRIAYRLSPGRGPGVIFLGGFGSDMTGTKARHLAEWAGRQGRAFLRFDYSGHGASQGAFAEGAIGDWFEDARAVIALTQGRQVLVGSSMGGWIALLLAREAPERIAGIVGIAAAPDFTEDGFYAAMTDAQRADLARGQATLVPPPPAAPVTVSRRLIEEARDRLVLRAPLHLPFPVRLLQGTADTAVPVATALRLLDHATGPDMRLTLVKGADHRFSTPECLALVEGAVAELCEV